MTGPETIPDAVPKAGQAWDRDFLVGHPLFRVFEPLAAELRGEDWPTHEGLSALAERQRLLRAPECDSLTFAPAKKRSRRAKRGAIRLEELYDGRIALAREVPCLSRSYHDLFNALVFAAFPRAKRALHQRQWRALSAWVDPAAATIPGERTREQDALTIFDEGGVVLAMSEAAEREWRRSEAPTGVAAMDGAVEPLLFGHALLEHLFEGHLSVRASALVCVVPEAALRAGGEVLDVVDRALAERLERGEEFREPRAESIFTLERTGAAVFGPPKESYFRRISLWV